MKTYNLTYIILILALLFSWGSYSGTQQNSIVSDTIITGADTQDAYLTLLKGKTIGLLTNQTGILATHQHLVDFLLDKKITLQTIFAPEHGFRGTADAGEPVKDGKDPKTGLPIVSLYGKNVKPTPEQLEGIQLMVFDLQDVGARFYTYISSLHYLMEACAEQGIPLLVLDRPNPNGAIIDGPVLDKKYSSFVGMHPVPILYGMTIGEYGQMINGERWLKNGIQCQLTVIKCLNYHHTMPYDLPVKPSPNLPNDLSVNLYASLCLFEGTQVSVGRGTEKQFQVYGSPYLTKTAFSFIPQPNFGAKTPLHNGVLCFGEDLSTTQKLTKIELNWIIKAYQLTDNKSKFFNSFFTKLAGTPQLQIQIEKGESVTKIRKTWQKDLDRFRKIRKKYLLY